MRRKVMKKVKKRKRRKMSKWSTPPWRGKTAAASTSRPYPKTLEDGNQRRHHHDPHLLPPYLYLPFLILRPLRESGHGRRVGNGHHIFPVSFHPSLSSGPPLSPSRSPSLLPASHPPPPNCFPRKSNQQRPEYRPP